MTNIKNDIGLFMINQYNPYQQTVFFTYHLIKTFYSISICFWEVMGIM